MADIIGIVKQMDCIEYLKTITNNFLDSCVTDPPYALSFMGADFDCFKSPKRYQEWCNAWGKELWRVLKPGSYILIFGSPRTYHRMACGIEDAGFDIQDSIHWLYGSGFPKGQNLRKAMEKEFLFRELSKQGKKYYESLNVEEKEKYVEDKVKEMGIRERVRTVLDDIGFVGDPNTQLKPSHEPIVVAQKPRKGIYVNNMLKWGVGAFNIDECRIAVSPNVDRVGEITKRKSRNLENVWEQKSGIKNEQNQRAGVLPIGRYPANLILSHHPDCKMVQEGETKPQSRGRNEGQNTGKYGIYGSRMRPSTEIEFKEIIPEVWECVEDCPVRVLNEQSGISDSLRATRPLIDEAKVSTKPIFGQCRDRIIHRFVDCGGAARFFYCAKPSVQERNEGLNGRNPHITIKPIDLMRYLIRLVTPKNGIVCDIFLGSGTTAIAAELEGIRWCGCDNNEEYCEIAKKRIEYYRKQKLIYPKRFKIKSPTRKALTEVFD